MWIGGYSQEWVVFILKMSLLISTGVFDINSSFKKAYSMCLLTLTFVWLKQVCMYILIHLTQNDGEVCLDVKVVVLLGKWQGVSGKEIFGQ